MHPNPFKYYEFNRVAEQGIVRASDIVLDLGCGRGHWTLELARRAKKVVGIDISKRQIEKARRCSRNSNLKEHVRFLCTTLEDAQLAPASFDRIFSFCVLEHISNLDEVLAVTLQLLKPGGELHVSVDSLASIKDRSLIEVHKKNHSVMQYFTPTSLRTTLHQNGFDVLEIFPILTGRLAQKEFEKRIQKGYKRSFGRRIQLYRSFLKEDLQGRSDEGIMLVARSARPSENE